MYSKHQSVSFLNTESSLSVYIPIGSLVFASRIGGAVLYGEPQFFQYNQLGGLSNLRGFRRGRFTGKTSFYNNNELRIPITDLNGYILRGKFGLSLFCDNGRVWMPEENSKTWHNGYGGGIWFLPFNKLAITATYGISNEDKVLGIAAGFLF